SQPSDLASAAGGVDFDGSDGELPKIREALGVSVVPTMLAGVKAFVVTPRGIAPRHRDGREQRKPEGVPAVSWAGWVSNPAGPSHWSRSLSSSSPGGCWPST